jgi:hypothetical protein
MLQVLAASRSESMTDVDLQNSESQLLNVLVSKF